MSFAFNEPTSTHPTVDAVSSTVTTEETPDVTIDVPDDTVVTDPVVPGGDDSEPAGNPGGEVTPGNGEEEPTGDKPEPTDSSEEVSFYFGDDEVGLEIDPTHREAFEEKGLDIDKLAAELYSKDGGFKLSDESYKAVCDAFGKFAIDAFLSGLKAQGDMAVSNWQKEQENIAAADAELYKSLTADIGGDDGWNRLEQFAEETLTDEEFEEFNAVMASGNQRLQRYAIKEMESRRKGVQGDDSVSLIEGNASPGVSADNAPLNARDYIKATAELGSKFPHDKAGYAAAQSALDARRRAGLASGL